MSTVPKVRRMRSDTLRNRRRLLQAAAEAFQADPGNVNMPAIAQRAEIATATAYRYFPSIDDLLDAYMTSVIEDLRDYSHASREQGRKLFTDVARHWIDQLKVHGPVMVQLRSRHGFLQRLDAREPLISTVREAWQRPIGELLRTLDLPSEQLRMALFLYNQMFDPREILDLLANTDMGPDDIVTRLTATFCGALTGWHHG